ncbi:hypothetical protein Q0812_01090 [Brevundimonas sp. 2R-24]|uniref:Uncharacterized protein n=1 Tax=Peiella sedimenti TaxID=3061083 RepID=A0ABT8SHT5_9CAUL|nr:hypothetical protein [Caulobacteraceae bacterium XZ-24]
MLLRLMTAAALAVSAPALAQTPPPGPPPGCAAVPHANEFDFWVGEWNVYGRNGQLGGSSRISKRSSGCAVLEEWTNAGGVEGLSLNFVDPDSGEWRQEWMGTNNYAGYRGALNARGQMVLHAEQMLFGRNGIVQRGPIRGAWTPLPNGHVIQHFQTRNADGTWSDSALLTYVPKASDPNGRDPEAGARGPVIEQAPAID